MAKAKTPEQVAELKSMFENFGKAQEALEAAEAAVEQEGAKVAAILTGIRDKFGAGPYDVRGKIVKISYHGKQGPHLLEVNTKAEPVL